MEDGCGGLWFADYRTYCHYRNGTRSFYATPSQPPDALGGNSGSVNALYRVPGASMIWGHRRARPQR
jgi:hypothetical protein